MGTTKSEFDWRVLLYMIVACGVASAAVPYGTLKMGLGVDFTMGAMFLGAVLFEGRYRGTRLAVVLNVIQTAVGAAGGVGFMVVILGAFYYIQDVFGRDIGFNPTWWQLCFWILVSAAIGIYVGALVRKTILDDTSLPWPTGHVSKSVIDTLTEEEVTETAETRRRVLWGSTAIGAFVAFLRDGFGVITSMVGNMSMLSMFTFDLTLIGLGMMIPLAVALSGLLGVWVILNFGEHIAMLGALGGVAPANMSTCMHYIESGSQLAWLPASLHWYVDAACGDASALIASPVHFKWLIMWNMWPATAGMLAAVITSIFISSFVHYLGKKRGDVGHTIVRSNADETISHKGIYLKLAGLVIALTLLQAAWFDMPFYQVLMAVSIQPILVIAGVRILAITGTGPVSLMANATQFAFGFIWPTHIQQNLNAAHIAADPQSSGESTLGAFWVARRVGGKFSTLMNAQLIAIAVAAVVVPLTFLSLVATYGIGLEPGQLSAPTSLKIASVAMIMEKGLDALPPGALTASLWAMVVGVVFEVLLAVRKRDRFGALVLDEQGNTKARFAWVPIPSALGFALILPPFVSIGFAVGAMAAFMWKTLSPSKNGSFATYRGPLAAGLLAGDMIVAGIAIPLLTMLSGWLTGLIM